MNPPTLSSAPLFQPRQTARALRDVAYRDESMAIAELIDNSVDAYATQVDVLLQTGPHTLPTGRTVQRIKEVAIADEGVGMNAETLAKALTYGGRPNLPARGRIGKYGMGLPTASGSQCQRFEVWTSEGQGSDLLHAYVDLEEIPEDSLPLVHVERVEQWPPLWRQRASQQISDSTRGTLVVWSKIDRITSRAETIYKHLTLRIGRIYRHRINDKKVSVRVAQFDGHAQSPIGERDHSILPIDPLFLMPKTFNPEPRWGEEPMFEKWASPTRNLHFIDVYAGKHHATIEVRFSVARPEALARENGVAPGRTERGRFANQMVGISVVREGRELFLENSVAGFGGYHAPQHRWWGCEVRFNADADDIFGVDSQKQAATKWSAAVSEVLAARREQAEGNMLALEDEDGSAETYTLRDLVAAIEGNIQELFREAKKRVRASSAGEVREAPTTADIAVKLADQAFADLPPTPADIERREMPDEDRIARLVQYLTAFGISNAEVVATDLVRRGAGFHFLSKALSTPQMFDVEPTTAGITVILLNSEHKLYECLSRLEPEQGGQNDFALVALRVAIIAWARFSLETNSERRQQLGLIAAEWGDVATRVYGELEALLPGGDDPDA